MQQARGAASPIHADVPKPGDIIKYSLLMYGSFLVEHYTTHTTRKGCTVQPHTRRWLYDTTEDGIIDIVVYLFAIVDELDTISKLGRQTHTHVVKVRRKTVEA